MANWKSLVVGHRTVTAGKKRHCARDKSHIISMGETLLEARSSSSMGYKGYCAKCGAEMVRKAQSTLRDLLPSLSK